MARTEAAGRVHIRAEGSTVADPLDAVEEGPTPRGACRGRTRRRGSARRQALDRDVAAVVVQRGEQPAEGGEGVEDHAAELPRWTPLSSVETVTTASARRGGSWSRGHAAARLTASATTKTSASSRSP